MPLPSDWPDYTGRIEAQKLADAIKQNWAVRGGKVETWIRPVFGTSERNCWAIESDLVGGYPKDWARD